MHQSKRRNLSCGMHSETSQIHEVGDLHSCELHSFVGNAFLHAFRLCWIAQSTVYRSAASKLDATSAIFVVMTALIHLHHCRHMHSVCSHPFVIPRAHGSCGNYFIQHTPAVQSDDFVCHLDHLHLCCQCRRVPHRQSASLAN